MAKNKNELLGSGVAGILGGRPAAQRTVPPPPEKEPYFSYRKGRPRKDDEHNAAFSEGKVFDPTSLWLERDQYRTVREMAQDRRVSIKEMMYILIDAGIGVVAKENAQ